MEARGTTVVGFSSASSRAPAFSMEYIVRYSHLPPPLAASLGPTYSRVEARFKLNSLYSYRMYDFMLVAAGGCGAKSSTAAAAVVSIYT